MAIKHGTAHVPFTFDDSMGPARDYLKETLEQDFAHYLADVWADIEVGQVEVDIE